MEFSEDFEVSSEAGKTDSWTTVSKNEFEVGVSEEFGGSFDGPAPENYLAVALANCFVATFKAMADRSGIDYESIHADGTLQVRPVEGETEVKRFEAAFTVKSPEEERKILTLMERAEKHCFVMDAVDVEKDLDFRVE
jgi:organic hydroperoxide reductase OsmC/OhrA